MKTQKNETQGLAPEKKFRAGAISATVWKNQGTSKDGKAVEYRTVSLQRSYTDRSGAWQTTTTMRVNDLPRATLVLTKAYEYLALKEQSPASEAYSSNAEIDVAEAI
jgi:hypothetical protein